MRDRRNAWFKPLLLLIVSAVTGSSLFAQDQQVGAPLSNTAGASEVKVWVRLNCRYLSDFLIEKAELEDKPAFRIEVGEVRRVIQGRVSGILFIGPERIVYHADERHPTLSFDESRAAVLWNLDYEPVTVRTSHRAMGIVGAHLFQKDNPPNTALVNDPNCTLLRLASSDFAAAEREFENETRRLPAVREARWRELRPAIAAWRALPTKPPLSLEADREWILAENAFKEQNFTSAVEHYEAALEIQPMWATGWFNLAMIYGELKQYADAADAMKHYLELVPNAPDAKSAREQTIIWEDKAKQ